jgi:hypothetical protein
LIDQIAVPQDTNEEAAVAAQIFRIDRKVDICRKGRIIKTTSIAFYGVTSLWVDEASPQQLLEVQTKPA